MLSLLAIIAALAWALLLMFWGRFWRADQRLDADAPAPADWPALVAVIPARDEAATIGRVALSHRHTGYPGGYPVIVVDDDSDDSDDSADGTGAIAREAGAHTIDAPPLEAGWSGKLSALNAGIAEAERLAPDARYLLLTDADIIHASDTAARLVARAERDGLAMVSLMARLDSRGLWGGLLIPAFVFFFQKLYPFPQVNDPKSGTAAAAGGCVLIRRDALAGIGGIAALRGALIDDCTLAAHVKRGPPRRAIWLGLATGEVTSLRDNRALGSVWTMVRRTAFTQLRHSPVLLAGSVVGMTLIYLVPPLATILGLATGNGLAAAAGAAGWAAMTLAYAPTLATYEQPPWRALFLPLAALLYTAMTIDSARHHWTGRGGAWKGRTYP